MTWIDLCISSKEVCLYPVSSSFLREEVPGRIKTVSRNFVGRSAESLEGWVVRAWVSDLLSRSASKWASAMLWVE
jgi:hypothetical protein